MAVDTKTVKGRREVSYESFDALLADAERMASVDVNTIGNWSLGQILRHLAKAINTTIDGVDFRAPWPLRFLGRIFLKKRLLANGIPSGFRIPARAKRHFQPEEVDAVVALEVLREAVKRINTEPNRAPHPFLGQLSRVESDLFQLRHAEMHMSFVVPAGG